MEAPPIRRKFPGFRQAWRDFQQLIAFAKMIQPVRSSLCAVNQTPQGTQILPLPLAIAAAVAALAANDFSISDGGSGKLGVKNGTVDGILPTGMSAGGDPAYQFTPSVANGYAYVVITKDTDTGETNSVSIATAAAVPADAADGSTAYQSIGDYAVTMSGGTSTISIGSGAQGIGSQVTQLCGSQVLWGPA